MPETSWQLRRSWEPALLPAHCRCINCQAPRIAYTLLPLPTPPPQRHEHDSQIASAKHMCAIDHLCLLHLSCTCLLGGSRAMTAVHVPVWSSDCRWYHIREAGVRQGCLGLRSQAILPYLVEHLRGDLLLIAIENIASQTSRLVRTTPHCACSVASSSQLV